MSNPKIQHLIAQGIALADAGKTNEAVALWHQAARRGSVDGFVNIGLLYSKLAFATDDPVRQSAYITSAIGAFQPIAAPEIGVPKAALNLGALLHEVGMNLLNAPDLTQEDRLQDSHKAFCKAAEFFQQAAAMPDSMKDGAPAQAMLKLADYALKGIGGFEKDEDLAIVWTEQAMKADPTLDVGPQLPKRKPSRQPRRDLN